MKSREKWALKSRLALAVAIGHLATEADAAISCSVTLPDIDFGAVDATKHRVRVNPQLSVSCAGGPPHGSVGFTVHLDYSGTMQGTGTDTIPYGLYKDSARTLSWRGYGMSQVLHLNAAGLSRADSNSRMAIHAEVRGFDLRNVAPDAYQDTVIAILEY